jgi:hypothetical protein
MRPQLDQIRGLPDFASLYRWNLIFDKFPTGIAAPNSEALNLRCVSATIPKVTGATFPLIIRGQETINPGRWNTSGTITLTFIETVDNVVLNFIQNWRSAVWAMNTGVGVTKAELLAIIRLERLDRSDNRIREYKLEAFISDYEPGGDLAAEGDTISPTITLAYDRFDETAV